MKKLIFLVIIYLFSSLCAFSQSNDILITPEGLNSKPAWSPCGKWLAFTSYREGCDNIWRIRLQDSFLEQLTNDSTFNYYPSWSPDGDLIAYEATVNNLTNIRFYNLKTGKIRQITQDGASRPEFSHDGKILLIMREKKGVQEYSVIDLKDYSRTVIMANDHSGSISRVIWGKNSKSLIYAVRPNWLVPEQGSRNVEFANSSTIWRFLLSEKKRKLLVAGGTEDNYSHVTVSPDLRYLAYINGDDLLIAKIEDLPAGEPFYRRKLNGYGITWSPAGNEIAYVKVPEYKIYLLELPDKEFGRQR